LELIRQKAIFILVSCHLHAITVKGTTPSKMGICLKIKLHSRQNTVWSFLAINFAVTHAYSSSYIAHVSQKFESTTSLIKAAPGKDPEMNVHDALKNTLNPPK
jgi:hypothetical protein